MPDGLVDAHGDGHLQLGPHAVGAGDQDRVFVLSREQAVGEIELEEAGEPPVERDDARRVGASQQFGESRHRLAINVEIDAGVLIGGFGHNVVRGGDRRHSNRSWPGEKRAPFGVPA